MLIPADQLLATYARLPLDGFDPPGNPPGSADAGNFIDFATPVSGRIHVGDDVRADPSTPVYAIAHGVVRFVAEHGSPSTGNWGWLIVVEHTFRSGRRVCSVYGHCAPTASATLGAFVPIGEHIGWIVDYTPGNPTWGNHLHFGVYDGPFASPAGSYPTWLTGYLPPASFPGRYIDPYVACTRLLAHASHDRTPGPGAARPIHSNAPLEGEGIDFPDDEDWFSFAGTAGQRIVAAVTRESGTLTPQLALFTTNDGAHPLQKVVGADIPSARPYLSASSWRIALTDYPLPFTTRYLLKIRGAGATTGLYRLVKRVYA